jgi:hypothetical protein
MILQEASTTPVPAFLTTPPSTRTHLRGQRFDLLFKLTYFKILKPKPQVLTKLGDESFFKLSKKVPPIFEPRISAA